MTPTLEVISGFGTGQVIGSLDLLEAVTTEQIDNNDALVATIRKPSGVTVRQRTKLRFTGSDGRIREYRVRRITRNANAQTWGIEAGAVWLDLATAGAVRVVSGTATAFTISATLTAAQWLSTYVLSNLTADGLEWLDTTLGTIEATGTRTLAFQNATRMEILQAVADAFQVEWQIAQPSPGALYRISLWSQRGGVNGTAYIAQARNLLTYAADAGDDQLATGVMPTGITPGGETELASIADNLWRIANIDTNWVTLADPAGGTGPIGIDDLVNGLYLFGPINTTAAPSGYFIADSRSSDHAVQLSSTTGLAIGDIVSIRSTADGAGVFELEHPVAKALYERLIAQYAVVNARGEANRVKDGRFANGLTEWAALNPQSTPAYAEIKRSETGITLNGQVAAARAAGTGVGTALQLKNLPANAWVRQQDQIIIAGATCAITGDTVPSTTGTFALTVSPGLPAAYADNTPVVLNRVMQRTVLLEQATPVLSPWLRFTDNGAFDDLWNNIGVTLTRVATTGSTGNATMQYVQNPSWYIQTLAGQMDTISAVNFATDSSLLRYITTIGPADGFTFGGVTGMVSGYYNGYYTYVTKGSAALAAIGHLAQVGHVLRSSQTNGGLSRLVRPDGTYQYIIDRWPAICTSVEDLGTQWKVNYEFWVPTGYTRCEFSTVPLYYSGSLYSITTTPAATSWYPINDSWTMSAARGSFNANLNGAHSSGATTINLKALGALQRRDMANGTALTTITQANATMAWTALSVTPSTDPAGDSYLFTIDTAASNIDERISSFVGRYVTFPTIGGGVTGAGTLYCESLAGNQLQMYALDGGPTPPSFASTGTSGAMRTEYEQVYSSTGAASWGTNGTVSVTVSPAIASWITHPKGTYVKLPWNSDTQGLCRIASDVTGGNTIVLRGSDYYMGSSPQTVGGTYSNSQVLFRIEANRGNIPFAGDTLTAASSVQADGSGNVNVTLAAANTNALSLDQNMSITRPALLRATDPTTGSIVRLLYAIGNSSIPQNTTPGIRSNYFRVEVPTGSTRLVTVYATIAMNAGTYALGQLPAVAIVDIGGNPQGYTRFADATVTVGSLVYGTLIAQFTATTSMSLALAVYGGFTNTPASWHALIEAWAVQSAATDVPFVQGSHANAMWAAAVKYLQVYARAVTKLTVSIAQLQQIAGVSVLPVAPMVGQTLNIEDTGDTVRLAAVLLDHFDYTRTELTLDTLRPTAARLLGVR